MDLNSRLVTLGSGSAAGGAGGESYWFLVVEGDQSDDLVGKSIATGTNKQSFLVFDYQNKMATICVDGDGAITWKKQISSVGSNSGGTMAGNMDIAVDSSDNVYVVGNTINGAVSWSNYDGITAKYNSSGVLQWAKNYGDSSAIERLSSVAVDGSGNVICHGVSYIVSGGALLFLKYDSSGSLVHKRIIGTTATDPYDSRASFVYSDGTIGYFASLKYSNIWRGAFVRHSSTSSAPSFTFSKYMTNSTSTQFAYDASMDSSENMIGVLRNDGTDRAIIIKVNSSGAEQWIKALDHNSATQVVFRGSAVDSSDNIYACGYWVNSSSVYKAVLIKYNSSGVIEWQRDVAHSNGFILFTGIAVNSLGDLAVSGYVKLSGDTEYSLVTARLPSDGSLTGTYGDFTYSAGAFVAYSGGTGLGNITSSNQATNELDATSPNTFGDASFSSTSLTTL